MKQEAEPPAARSRKQKSKTQDAQGKAASKSAQKSAKGSSANKTKMVAVKREKKKFDLPGQTRDTPDEVNDAFVACSTKQNRLCTSHTVSRPSGFGCGLSGLDFMKLVHASIWLIMMAQ